MEIKNLLTFIQVAELNSFTKAADSLGYSQSTVSSQIKQLEEELHCQLFERIYKTIALTDKGKEVLKFAHQMTKITHDLQTKIQNTDTVQGHVRLALADSLIPSLLLEHFSLLTRTYPHITLKMTSAGTEELFRLLNHNEADLILTLDNHIYNTDYIIVHEEKINIHFVVSSDHQLAQRKKITIEELIQYPFLLTEKGMSYRRLFDDRLAEYSLEVHPILELGSAHLLCSLVEQGIGVSLLPEYVTHQSFQEGKVKYIEVENFHIEVWKQLLYHKNKWITPAMKSVIQFIQEKNK